MFYKLRLSRLKRTLLLSTIAGAGFGLMSTAALGADQLDQNVISTSPQWYFALQGAYGPALNGAGWEGSSFGSGESSFDNAYVAGFSVGRFLDENWRVGIELNLFGFENDYITQSVINPSRLELTGSVNGVYGFADVGYEKMFNNKFGGFVEAGLGFVQVSSNNMTLVNPLIPDFVLSGSTTTFAGKVGAGLKYVVNENLDLFGKYNYIHAGDAKWTDNFGNEYTSELRSHAVMFGVRLKM